MNITEFLEARITADEAAARAAIEDDGGSDEGFSMQYELLTKPPSGLGYAKGGFGYAAARMIATYAVPARVLAECKAKRALSALHSPGDYRGQLTCNDCGDWWDGSPIDYPCKTIRIIAAVYKDHPDYQEEWTA